MPKRKREPESKPAPEPIAPSAQDPESDLAELSDPLLPCNLRQELADMEIEYLRHAMEESRFNQRVAAEALGLSYHQLRACLRKHNLLGEVGRARNALDQPAA